MKIASLVNTGNTWNLFINNFHKNNTFFTIRNTIDFWLVYFIILLLITYYLLYMLLKKKRFFVFKCDNTYNRGLKDICSKNLRNNGAIDTHKQNKKKR